MTKSFIHCCFKDIYCIRTAIFSMSLHVSVTCRGTICNVMLPTLLDCSIFNHASVRVSGLITLYM